MSKVIELIFIYGVLLFFFRFVGLRLAKCSGSDIRLVSYLAALSGTLACVVASIASGLGAIDASGNFVGSAGKHVQAILHLVLDLSTDLLLVLAGFVIVLLPQLICIVVSGLFGRARWPLHVDVTLRVAFWFCVKPLVTVGGVLLALATYGFIHSWAGMTLATSAVLGWFGLALIVEALAFIYLYRDIPTKIPSLRGFGWVKIVWRWFTRAENDDA